MKTNNPGDDAVIIEPLVDHRASVIWLHGLGADGHDFEAIVPELGLSKELGIRFIFPHAPLRPVTINGGMVMRAWYDIKDPDLSVQRDRQDFDSSAAILEAWINSEIEAGIPANRIIAAGFSQGGAITLHCCLGLSKQLAGIMALSCYLPFADVIEGEQATTNKDTSILMMHGEYDPVIPVEFARQSCEILRQHHYPIEWHDFPMQHGVCQEEITRVAKWLTTRLTLKVPE
jgi:phospholipase/carboxylesterase